MESKLAKAAAIFGILASLGGVYTWTISTVATKSDIEDVKKQIALTSIELSIAQAEDSLYVLDRAVDEGAILNATEQRRYTSLQARIARLTAEKERRISE